MGCPTIAQSVSVQQTNTADMLDLAVEYIKDLQKQVKVMFQIQGVGFQLAICNFESQSRICNFGKMGKTPVFAKL